MATSSKDIETLWQRYSEEGSKKGISVRDFFEKNGVPYHVFEKWYKRKYQHPEIVDCKVTGFQTLRRSSLKKNHAMETHTSQRRSHTSALLSAMGSRWNIAGSTIQDFSLSFQNSKAYVQYKRSHEFQVYP